MTFENSDGRDVTIAAVGADLSAADEFDTSVLPHSAQKSNHDELKAELHKAIVDDGETPRQIANRLQIDSDFSIETVDADALFGDGPASEVIGEIIRDNLYNLSPENLKEAIAKDGKQIVFKSPIFPALIYAYYKEPGRWQTVLDALKAEKVNIQLLTREIKNANKTTGLRTGPRDDSDFNGYKFENGQILFFNPLVNDWERIANFNATITADVTFDDDVESRREYEITGRIVGESKTRTGRIRAEDFRKPNWIEAVFGAAAVVAPRRFEHTCAAVKEHSTERIEESVIAFCGWKKVGNDWLFYHAGGALGADGPVPANVELEPNLEGYDLAQPATGDELQTAFDEYWKLYKVQPARIAAPLMGATLTPLVDFPRFTSFSIGETGFFKTTLNLLYISFFGSRFVAEDKPPLDWNGTVYAHQFTAHTAANLPLLIDEYVPRSSANPDQMRRVCTEMLRSQGNGSGRNLGKATGGTRKQRYPRGLIMATGEDVPDGRSMRARIVVVEHSEAITDQTKAEISKLQTLARDGVFASLGAAYVQWLAARIANVLDLRQDIIQALRVQWLEALKSARVHSRTASNFASLERAWRTFFEFAKDRGLIDAAGAATRLESIKAGLLEAAKAQAPWLADSDPVTKFVRLVGVAMMSGKAYLAPCDRYEFTEDDYVAVGWRTFDDEMRRTSLPVWRPLGDCIGWMDDTDIYLMPDAARRVADSFLPAYLQASTSKRQFEAQLNNAGILQREGKREAFTVRKRIGAKQEKVYKIARNLILDYKPEDEDDD